MGVMIYLSLMAAIFNLMYGDKLNYRFSNDIEKSKKMKVFHTWFLIVSATALAVAEIIANV